MDPVLAATPFTSIERFSLTAKCTQTMMKWNHSDKQRILGQVSARIVGCIAVSLAIIADIFFHLALALSKGSIVWPTKPFKLCFPKIPRDLDVSSPVVHFMFAIDRGTKIASLPFIMIFDPDRAYRGAQTDGISNKELLYYKNKLKDLEQGQKNKKEDPLEIARLSKELENMKLQAKKLNEENAKKQADIKGAEEQLNATTVESQAIIEDLIKKLEALQNNDVKPVEGKEKDIVQGNKLAEEDVKIIGKGIAKNLINEFEAAEKKINGEQGAKGLIPFQKLEKNEERPKSPVSSPKIVRSPSKENPPFQGGGSGLGVMIMQNVDVNVFNANGIMLADMLKNKATKLKPINTELEMQKTKADKILDGPTFKKYYGFVEAMILYFEGFLGIGTPYKIDFKEIDPYGKDANKEIKMASDAEVAKQRLNLYRKVQEHIQPRFEQRKIDKKNLNGVHKKQEIENDQERLRAEKIQAELKTKNEKAKLLKTLSFVDVQKTAALDENIIQTNKMIKDAVVGKQTNIADFDSLIAKIDELKNQFSKKQKLNPEDETEEFKLVVQLIKLINSAYVDSVAWNDRAAKSFNKNEALKLLSFINVEEEATRGYYYNQAKERVQSVCKDIKDFIAFKVLLKSMKQEIELGQKVNGEKLGLYQRIVADLNNGSYLGSSVNKLSFKFG